MQALVADLEAQLETAQQVRGGVGGWGLNEGAKGTWKQMMLVFKASSTLLLLLPAQEASVSQRDSNRALAEMRRQMERSM
jgi:hypothetical protein